MRGSNSSVVAGSSRVHGQGRLLCSLRLLVRRVERFAMARACSDAQRRWAAKLADALDGAYAEALSAPGSRQALAAVDARRARSQKGR
jgi:hypothetical protein